MSKPKSNHAPDSLAAATEELHALVEQHGSEGFGAPGDGVGAFPIGRFLDLLMKIIQGVRPFVPEGEEPK